MKTLLIALSLCLTSAGASAKDAPAEVLTEGNGYKTLLVESETFDRLFNLQQPPSNRGSASPQAGPTTKSANPPNSPDTLSRVIISITTLRGVLEARLPAWLQDELLAENGFQSWNEVTEELLDAPIAMNFFSLDALAQIDEVGASRGIFNICEKDRDHQQKHFSESIDISELTNLNISAGGADANLDTSLQGAATVSADVRYAIKIRENCPFDFAYGVEFESAEVVFDATLEGDMQIDGYASYELQRQLMQHTINLWHKEYDWWTWLIQFELELDLKVDLGIELTVDAAATFNADFNANGTIGMTWDCTSHGCATSRNETDLTFAQPFDPNYAAQIRVIVTPFADTNFKADLDAYEGLVDVAKGQIGIVAALPVDFFGYYGNLCSDADQDGTRELVSAQLVDISAELYAYLKYEFLGFDATIPIDLGLVDYDLSLRVEPYTGSFNAIIYRKSLVFRDLIAGGSAVIEPVLNFEEISAIEGGIGLSTRSCYPYQDDVVYEIDWGDGTGRYIGTGGYVEHTWNYLGDYFVRARMVSDDADRSFEERWISVPVHVSPNGQTRFYPWLMPVLSLTME